MASRAEHLRRKEQALRPLRSLALGLWVWLCCVRLQLCISFSATPIPRAGLLPRGHLAHPRVAAAAVASAGPVDEVHVCRVIKSDGTQSTFRVQPSIELANGWHLTQQALEGKEGGIDFDYYGGDYGHVAKTILGVNQPGDGSWFWALYVYGSFTNEWLRAPSCSDLVNLDTYPHIAWVAVRTAATEKHLEDDRVFRLLGASPEP
mmetsp:Transcript_124406/g.278036  ORF Transcript_124406/g.278036 Transcript_124406/m.278036 type:complete len:205 (+) Transcript_124406:86-700(+)